LFIRSKTLYRYDEKVYEKQIAHSVEKVNRNALVKTQEEISSSVSNEER
jgi:hypothetical protein